MTRRQFFDKILAAIFGAGGLAFLGSAAAFLYPNKKFISGTRQLQDTNGRSIAPDEIEEGGFKTGVILGTPAIVLRRNDELIAYSRICTHLGCTVSFYQEDEIFECPCHGAVYDIDGKVLEGPPPKPLPRLNIRVEKDKIILI